jgi:hypothetical protein
MARQRNATAAFAARPSVWLRHTNLSKRYVEQPLEGRRVRDLAVSNLARIMSVMGQVLARALVKGGRVHPS